MTWPWNGVYYKKDQNLSANSCSRSRFQSIELMMMESYHDLVPLLTSICSFLLLATRRGVEKTQEQAQI